LNIDGFEEKPQSLLKPRLGTRSAIRNATCPEARSKTVSVSQRYWNLGKSTPIKMDGMERKKNKKHDVLSCKLPGVELVLSLTFRRQVTV
jgi:hypothetical protein